MDDNSRRQVTSVLSTVLIEGGQSYYEKVTAVDLKKKAVDSESFKGIL